MCRRAGYALRWTGVLDAHESLEVAAASGTGVYRPDAGHAGAGAAHADVLCGDGTSECYRHRGGHRHLRHEYGGLHQRDAAHHHSGHRLRTDGGRTGLGLHPETDVPENCAATGGPCGDARLSGRDYQSAEGHEHRGLRRRSRHDASLGPDTLAHVRRLLPPHRDGRHLLRRGVAHRNAAPVVSRTAAREGCRSGRGAADSRSTVLRADAHGRRFLFSQDNRRHRCPAAVQGPVGQARGRHHWQHPGHRRHQPGSRCRHPAHGHHDRPAGCPGERQGGRGGQ